MCAVKIGHARGKSSGLGITDYYTRSEGWVVARPFNYATASLTALKMVTCMVKACNNPYIGYDLGLRDTLYNAVKNKNFDPGTVLSLVYTDCSALIRVCCCYAGIPLRDISTSDELSALLATGLFAKIDFDNSDPSLLMLGDILITKTKGHTALVVSTTGEIGVGSGMSISSLLSNGGFGAGSSSGRGSVTRQYSVDVLTLYVTLRNILTYKYSVESETKTIEYTHDQIMHAAEDVDLINTSLLSYPNLVETPFILLRVGGYVFGTYKKDGKSTSPPNYISSMKVKKINGEVNLYSIELVHKIEAGADPNIVDKILSGIGIGGKVYISYGDYQQPSLAYRVEEAILLKSTSNVDFKSSRISYSLSCTSNATTLYSRLYSFDEHKNTRPSSLIIDMLWNCNNKYGLLDAFPGMKNESEAIRYLALDDAAVDIPAKLPMNPLAYLNYLVSFMHCTTDSSTDDVLKNSTYVLSIQDDTFDEAGLPKGSIFKISKISTLTDSKTLVTGGIYEVDVGFPSTGSVINFSINENNSWSLLYSYAGDVKEPVYNIDNDGNVTTEYLPKIAVSNKLNTVTEAQRTWWTNMTQFPIKASLTLKGLATPVNLMDYIRINALFYGQRHITSGLYVVTALTDSISASGYRTTLDLLRISGDDTYIKKVTIKKDILVPKITVEPDTVIAGKTIVYHSYSYTETKITTPTINASMYMQDIGNFEPYDINMEAEVGTGDLSGINMENARGLIKLFMANGMTLEGACGAVGNFCHESGVRTHTVEYLLCSKIKKAGGPDYKANPGLYTTGVDNGMYNRLSASGVRMITESEYKWPLLNYGDPAGKGQGGHQRYGYGLAQWTTEDRKMGLYNLAKSRHMSIGSYLMLGEWIIKELETSYKGVFNTLKTTHSLSEATKVFFNKYEGINDGSGDARLSYANALYREMEPSANYLKNMGMI